MFRSWTRSWHRSCQGNSLIGTDRKHADPVLRNASGPGLPLMILRTLATMARSNIGVRGCGPRLKLLVGVGSGVCMKIFPILREIRWTGAKNRGLVGIAADQNRDNRSQRWVCEHPC